MQKKAKELEKGDIIRFDIHTIKGVKTVEREVSRIEKADGKDMAKIVFNVNIEENGCYSAWKFADWDGEFKVVNLG